MKRILIIPLALGFCGSLAFASSNACKTAFAGKSLIQLYLPKVFPDNTIISRQDLSLSTPENAQNVRDQLKIKHDEQPKDINVLISYYLFLQRLTNLGQDDLAIQVQLAKAIIEIQGPTSENLAWLITAAKRNGDFELLLETGQRLISIDPENVRARENLVYDLVTFGLRLRYNDYFRIIGLCEQYLAESPNNLRILQTLMTAQLNLARIPTPNPIFHKERWENVIPTIENLLRIDTRSSYYFELAYALIKKGKFFEATALLDTARIKLNPRKVKVIQFRIAVYQKDFIRAQVLLDQLTADAPAEDEYAKLETARLTEWLNRKMNAEFDRNADRFDSGTTD